MAIQVHESQVQCGYCDATFYVAPVIGYAWCPLCEPTTTRTVAEDAREELAP